MPANAEIAYSVILEIAIFDFPYVKDITDWVKGKMLEFVPQQDKSI